MNIISLNYNDIAAFNNKEGMSEAPYFAAGEQISGIYRDNGNSKYLDIDGNKLSLSKDARLVAKDGDEVTFDVVKSDKNTISLKQIFPKAIEGTNKKTESNKTIYDALFEYLDFEKEEKSVKDMITNRVKEHKEKMAEINRIKALIKYSVNNISKNVYAKLNGLGLSAEKIGAETLAGIVYEVSNHEGKSLKGAFTEENIAIHANREALILTSLKESNLPTSDDNINKLRSLLSSSNEVFPVSEGECLSFIKNFDDYNLENLYKAKFMTDDLKSGNTFSENEDIFQGFLKREGIESTEGNLKILKTFFVNGIDITKENFDLYNALTQADNISDAFVLEGGIANIKNSTPIMQMPIWSVINKENLYEKYENVSDMLSQAENTNIYEHGECKTLSEMSAIYSSQKYNLKTVSSGEYYRELRQVVEIQLRLTSYNMYRLSSLNVDITNMPLNKALEHLKEAESRFYEGVIAHNGMKPTTEMVSTLSSTMVSIRQISAIPTSTSGGSVTISSSITIQSLAMASISYDASKTEYNPKFKDSFAKIEEQFGDILKSLGISDTEENIKAAKACSRAGLDFTEENIFGARAISYKLDKIKEMLTPTILLNMMKEGFNPLSENIDNVIEYAEKLRNELSEDLPKKVAEQIHEMDKQGILSIDRDSIISFYKMINKIERYSSAAVGLVVAEGRDVNFKNLYAASEVFAKNKLKYSCYDRKLDIGSGELLNNGYENILDKIVKPMQEAGIYNEEAAKLVDKSGFAYTKDNVTIANNLVNNNGGTLTKFYESVYKHDVLKDIFSNPPKYGSISDEISLAHIESLLEEISSADTTSMDNISTRAVEMLKTNPALLGLIASKGMPLSIKNIEKVKELQEDDFYLKNKLNDNISLFDGFMEDKDEGIASGLTGYLKNLRSEEPDNSRFNEMNDILDTLRILSALDRGRSFHIPFRSVDNLFSELNVFVVDENYMDKESFTAVISINTTIYKDLTGIAEISGNDVSIKLSVNTTNERESILKEEISKAISSMDSLGINISVSFVSRETEGIVKDANIVNALLDNYSSFEALL